MKVTLAHAGWTGTSIHDKILPFMLIFNNIISIKAEDHGEEAIYWFSATAVKMVSMLLHGGRFLFG